MDAVSIHPAQGGAVNSIDGGTVSPPEGTGDLTTGIVIIICSCGNSQLLRVDVTVQLNAAGHQIQHLLGRGVHPVPLNEDIPLSDAKTFQGADGAQIGFTGSEGDTIGIDESTAAAGDTVRVGHHHIRFAAGDFGKTGEPAAVSGDHLIKDHLRALLHIKVGIYLPGELCCPGGFVRRGVVQYQPLRVHIVTVIKIV